MRDDGIRTYGMAPGRRGGNLLRQAYLLTGDAGQAEKLTQRALAAATLHTRRFGPAGADEYARAELIRSFVADPGWQAPGRPPGPGGRTEVWDALGTLPPRRRAVIVLRYDEGLSEEEIAARMGSTPRSITADAEAGLLTLRTALNGEGDPGRLVSAALADAGGRWARWSGREGSGGAQAGAARDPGARDNGRTPAGQARTTPPAQPGASHGPTGQTRTGWTRTSARAGQTAGQTPSETPSGQTAASQASVGQTLSGQTPSGPTATGRATNGLTPSGQSSARQTPVAQTRHGQIPNGQIPNDETPTGWTSHGQASAGPSRTRAGLPGLGSLALGSIAPAPDGPDPDAQPRIGQAWPGQARIGQVPAAGGTHEATTAVPNGAAARPAGDQTAKRGAWAAPDAPPARYRAAARAVAAAIPESTRGRLRGRGGIAAAALTALVLAAAAVGVPLLLRDRGGAPAAPAPAAARSAAAAVGTAVASKVPSRSVPKGLLDWPPRGPQSADARVLSTAAAAWRAKAKPAEAPATGVSLLYAGTMDDREVVLLQALDQAGRPRLAQVTGPDPGSLSLVHAEQLHMSASVLTILPAAGPSGPIRVLVSPEAQAANGLLASDVKQMPLTKMSLDRDGVSEILPSPPGVPTCSRIVVMGSPAPLGGGPRVLESAVASADMLTAMPMDVEVATSTLAPADGTTPETVWFNDGKKLAQKIGGGHIVVAALGPRLPARPVSATDRRTVESRAYEIHRGGQLYIGSVVTLGGTTICTTVLPVKAGSSGALSAFVLRCPIPGGSGGVLHIVGGPNVQSVQVQLAPTPEPVGQRPYGNSVDRPEASPPVGGFGVLDVVPSGFPCGGGTVQATGGAGSAPPMMLSVYTP